MIEEVLLTILRETLRERGMDLRILLRNVSDGTVALGAEAGAPGGVYITVEESRGPFDFHSSENAPAPSAAMYGARWGNLLINAVRGARPAGVLMFTHPDNSRGFAEGWEWSDTGLLGLRWPAAGILELEPGDAVALSYRIILHSGLLTPAELEAHYLDFLRAVQDTN